MSSTGPIATLSPREHDAVLFDMDGVLTQTASIHAVAWKQLFDAFLERRSVAAGEPFTPFDIETDYRRYVDGKPRYDGVEAFLRSRGIDLPQGTNEDGPEVESVHGLGNRKDRYFMEHLERHGVQTFEAAVDLVRALRAQGVRTAVVTSSINCEAVLREAGIADLFDVRVDGLDITRLGLRGKPAPDAFLEAARRMHIEPSRSVVVEDAIAGVEAGRVVENEDLVNLPNWLSLIFRIEHDEWFDLHAVTIRSYRQELDLRRGVLSTAMEIEDAQGRRTALVERRFVSMSDMHLGALGGPPS